MAQLDLMALIEAAATKNGIPPNLLAAVIRAESSNNPKAVSPKGAQGLGQLMPETAKRLGVTDPFDPVQNVNAAATLLGRLMRKYQGSVTKALAAYNAGEPAVDVVGGVPNFPETINYIKRVTEYVDAASKTPNFKAPATKPQGPGLPGESISVDRGGKPPPTQQLVASAAKPIQEPVQARSLGRISDAQVQAVLDAIAMENQGVPLDMSRQYTELQNGAYGGVPIEQPVAPEVTQPSLASFYSGGTFEPPKVEGGLGWLSRLFKPSGGPTFSDYTPSER